MHSRTTSNKKLNFTVRPIRPEELPALQEFLYQAIFVPEGAEPPPRSLLEDPALAIYTVGFGSHRDDHCLVAEANANLVGAVWVRIMNDFGHIDDDTPSLALSVMPEYRGMGVGSGLLRQMLAYLKGQGYAYVSLSVQKANYALALYQKAGFEVWRENSEDLIMRCKLDEALT